MIGGKIHNLQQLAVSTFGKWLIPQLGLKMTV